MRIRRMRPRISGEVVQVKLSGEVVQPRVKVTAIDVNFTCKLPSVICFITLCPYAFYWLEYM